MKNTWDLGSKVFCGIFSGTGDVLLTASQDRKIRLYNVNRDCFKSSDIILAKDVGWSIVDVDFADDGSKIIYSSWSPYIHMVDLENGSHVALPVNSENYYNHFCIFSLKFSKNNSQILCGLVFISF